MVRIKSIVGNNFSGKTCILRLDLNIPLSEDGEILDDTRILESIPTIDYLINQSAKVIIISHIGRPKGKFNKNYSFKPLIQDISKRINREIFFKSSLLFFMGGDFCLVIKKITKKAPKAKR